MAALILKPARDKVLSRSLSGFPHDCRRYEFRDGLSRAQQDARVESNAGAVYRVDHVKSDRLLGRISAINRYRGTGDLPGCI